MRRQDKRAEIELAEVDLAREGYLLKRALESKERELQLLGVMQQRGCFILDAGCGPGTFSIMLARNENSVVGIDLSTKVAIAAKERAERERVNFSPVVGDMERMPFSKNIFDLCFCGEVLHHFANIELVVRELTRVLKPGGTFTCVELNGSNPLVKLSRIIGIKVMRRWRLLREYGTHNVRIHSHRYYVNMLRKHGITNIVVSSCYHGPSQLSLKPKHSGTLENRVLVLLSNAYTLGIHLLEKILPQPYKGNILLITGTKER